MYKRMRCITCNIIKEGGKGFMKKYKKIYIPCVITLFTIIVIISIIFSLKKGKEIVYNEESDFYEAEDATLQKGVSISNHKNGYTGTGYVTGFEKDGDGVEFTIEVQKDGFYDLFFVIASMDGYKENNVTLDGEFIGSIAANKETFEDYTLEKTYVSAGIHKVEFLKNWGWVHLDSLKVRESSAMENDLYEVSSKLSNPNVDDHTKRLFQYLTDIYGTYTIAGQHSEGGFYGAEFQAIKKITEKSPGLLGLDMIEYSPSRVANGSTSTAIEKAIQFDELGGIVAFCWHWNAPEKYLYNSEKQPWWKGFYVEGSNINLANIMNGKDQEGYTLLLSDIDEIAVQLKRLQEAGVPILWRPLHEASGGWFWWGAAGAEAYKKLYVLMYDRLTNYHGLNNLIWVWNGQDPGWYPGDEYVDIIGEDVYPGEKVYTSQMAKFIKCRNVTKNNKLIAMTENGCLMDPDLVYRDNNRWLFYMTWEGEFVVKNGLIIKYSQQYSEQYMLEKVYQSEHVLTLDELPDLKNYGSK